MDKDEINKRVAEIMEPGPIDPRDFSRLLADEKFGNGYTWSEDEDDAWTTPGGAWKLRMWDDSGWVPSPFCTDIAAAWRAVEWATKHKARIASIEYFSEAEDAEWFAQFDSETAEAPTAPMAIALAFIEAFGGDK